MGDELSRKHKYILLKLSNSFETEQDIKDNILNRVQSEPLRTNNIPEDISESEKNFFYRWKNPTETNTVVFDTGIEVSFLIATAECEYGKKRVFDELTGVILPKVDRLNISYVDTIFVQFDNEWYCIVSTFNDYDLGRVKKLLGRNNIVEVSDEFAVESEMFQWLFYKYLKKEYELDDLMYLDNINGFTGVVVNDDNFFEGRSIQTAELIITKAFITHGYPLTSIQLVLKSQNFDIRFYLNERSDEGELEVIIQKKSSATVLLNNINIEFILPIYVYFYIVPNLVSLFKHDEAKFINGNKKTFLSKIGVEVIKSIMNTNKITLDSLK